MQRSGKRGSIGVNVIEERDIHTQISGSGCTEKKKRMRCLRHRGTRVGLFLSFCSVQAQLLATLIVCHIAGYRVAGEI